MSNKPRSKPQSKRPVFHAEQQRRARRRTVLIAAGIAIAAVFALIVATGTSEDSGDAVSAGGGGAPEGTESIEVGSASHVQGEVDYGQDPPAGGDHNDVWQNCGFYDEPVTPELAVHSLEHGAVWITHDPALPESEVRRLRDLVLGQSYVLVSPYEGLDDPIVASAWGRQIRLDGADDARLEEFIAAFRQGDQAPEPGAPCTGGQGQPQ